MEAENYGDWKQKPWREFLLYVDDKEEIQKVLGAFDFNKKNILEVGCATGRLTKIIAKYANHVVGIDLSQEMIDYATSNQSGKNIKYTVGDVAKLPFDNEVFDAVVSVYCLHHVSDLDKALEEMSRVSKGRILMLEPLDENAFDYLNREVRIRSGYNPTSHVSNCMWINLLTKMNEIGYRWRSDIVRALHTYPDIKTATRLLSYAFDLDKDMERILTDSLKARYESKPIMLPAASMLISAEKKGHILI